MQSVWSQNDALPFAYYIKYGTQPIAIDFDWFIWNQTIQEK